VAESKKQIVMVAGGAGKIGQCIAETLASLGAHVVVGDVLEEAAIAVSNQVIAAGGSSSHAKMDATCVTDPDGVVQQVVREHGRIDALVSNVGINTYQNAWELDEQHWRDAIDVNLSGAWWCCRAALKPMMKQRNGRIVFISSIVARIPGTRISPACAAAKAGIIGLTVALSLQMERYGILVNAITAGSTENSGHDIASEIRQCPSQYPLGFGGPQPIADGVAYLLGPSGKWLSGSILNISGGTFKGI
jgi:NAD(P)-dependent dehydrogenase (short-subunit alcohol dehydrogenase family)